MCADFRVIIFKVMKCVREALDKFSYIFANFSFISRLDHLSGLFVRSDPAVLSDINISVTG